MGRTRTVTLDEHEEQYVQSRVISGRHGTASAVMRDALRLLEDREQQLEALRAALIEGENSGDAVEWDVDTFLARMHAEQER